MIVYIEQVSESVYFLIHRGVNTYHVMIRKIDNDDEMSEYYIRSILHGHPSNTEEAIFEAKRHVNSLLISDKWQKYDKQY